MYTMAARNGSALRASSKPHTYDGRFGVQHSERIDSFHAEEEHFFGSYEAERVNAERSTTLELDSAEARPPSAEDLARFNRFRRPVAWVMAAMGSLSLVALGQHGFQQPSRGEVVAHIGSATAIATPAAANNPGAAAGAGRKSAWASAAEPTTQVPWSWTELAESALAVVLEPAPSATLARTLPSPAESATWAMQASLVNDFTSELLSMCREAPSDQYWFFG